MENDADIQSLQEKIDCDNQEAWTVRVSDSARSYNLSQEAVNSSRKISYKQGLANGLRTLAFCNVRLSRHEEAVPLLDEALPLFEELNDLKGQADFYEIRAIIKRNWGELGNSLELLMKALAISEQNSFRENVATHNYQLGVTYKLLGSFEKALDHFYKSMSVCREIGNSLFESYSINVIGSIYFETGDYKKALDHFLQGLPMRQAAGDKWGEAGSLDNIGFTYLKLKDYEKAVDYCKRSIAITASTGDKRGHANTLLHLAEIYKESGDSDQSARFSGESLEIRKAYGDKRGESEILLFLAGLPGKDPSEIFAWLTGALKIAEEIKALDLLSRIRFGLYQYHKKAADFKEAVRQLELYIETEKELHKNAINQKIANLEISHKAEEAKREADAIKQRNKELTELNNAIQKQKQQLEKALAELQSAQAQLIQAEKMASLGELTAGIAHEIQNPLNFVNNFSEVSDELLDEMVTELENDHKAEALGIAGEVKNNLEKILHHGKRADNIVKGMLLHSRSSTGVKEPVNINELADEYFRLAYHGFRAKDKSFNVTMKKDYDESIGNLSVVPQDIGRVILNLITNAFYAASLPAQGGFSDSATIENPTVWLSTKKAGENVLISVRDNGPGIPKNILDKIFQPFFTTKPTGEGTGLGLSLSYDIVKAHGGELKVNTVENEGTEFVISLPLQQ